MRDTLQSEVYKKTTFNTSHFRFLKTHCFPWIANKRRGFDNTSINKTDFSNYDCKMILYVYKMHAFEAK